MLEAAPSEEGTRAEVAGSTAASRVGGNASGALDVETRDRYRERLAELEAERAEAERFNDHTRVETAAREIERLTQELACLVRPAGRDPRVGTATERARLNVTRALATVLRKIAREHPALGEHLDATIRRGTVFSYTPGLWSPVRRDV